MPLFQPYSSDGENEVRCPFNIYAINEKDAVDKANKFVLKYNKDEIIYNFLCPKRLGACAVVTNAVELVPNELGVVVLGG